MKGVVSERSGLKNGMVFGNMKGMVSEKNGLKNGMVFENVMGVVSEKKSGLIRGVVSHR